MTVSADGEMITVHIPITFRKRGGRKLVMTPDGAEWAPRPRVDNAIVKALARAFRKLSSGARLRTPSLLTHRRQACLHRRWHLLGNDLEVDEL